MRTIKFRAWNPKSKRMYIIDVLALGEVTWSCSSENGMSMAYQPHIEVMQFTGLLDKNGDDIYEGDIIEGRRNKGDEPGENIGSIGWDSEKGCFGIYHTPDVSSVLFAYESIVDDCKVIGNIYENENLLN